MKMMKSFFLLCAFSVLFISCGSMTAIEEHRGNGDKKIYDASYETLFPMIVNIVNSKEKLIVHKIDEENGTIFAEGKFGGSTVGEYVGIWVTKNSSDTKCRVEIDIERKLKTNVTATQWGDIIFDELDNIFFNDF